MAFSDVVILIPGFLGFDQIGHFSYFANRVGAALRGCLVGLADRDIPVVPIKTCPTETLANRQLALLQAMRQIDCRLGPVERLHLVGHSTGGVDAYLLTGERPLQPGASWLDLDPDQIRYKIGTITTIASPHLGTCLALSPLARFFRHPVQGIGYSPSVAATLWNLGFSLHLDEMSLGAVGGALADTGSAAAYIFDVLRSRTLVDDLRPRHLAQTRRQFTRELCVKVYNVVTMAGRYTRNYTAGRRKPRERGPDRFFQRMYEYTAGNGYDAVDDDRPAVSQAMTAIAAALLTDKRIGNPNVKLRRVTSRLNDGLVNSARQMADPNKDKELLAVVIGDHMDVAGYYPRWVTTYWGKSEQKQKQLRSGILHSGSGFGDEQFFALYQRVAKAIVAKSEGEDIA